MRQQGGRQRERGGRCVKDCVREGDSGKGRSDEGLLSEGIGVTGGVQREFGAPWERLQTTAAKGLCTSFPESPTNSHTLSTPSQ
jgi:hypothetical protein